MLEELFVDPGEGVNVAAVSRGILVLFGSAVDVSEAEHVFHAVLHTHENFPLVGYDLWYGFPFGVLHRHGVEALLLKGLYDRLVLGILEVREEFVSLPEVVDQNLGFAFDVNDLEIVKGVFHAVQFVFVQFLQVSEGGAREFPFRILVIEDEGRIRAVKLSLSQIDFVVVQGHPLDVPLVQIEKILLHPVNELGRDVTDVLDFHPVDRIFIGFANETRAAEPFHLISNDQLGEVRSGTVLEGNHFSDAGIAGLPLGRIDDAKLGVLPGAFRRLVNDPKVKENGGNVLHLIVRVGGIVRLAGTADEPPLRSLSHFNRFGLQVLLVDLNDFDSRRRPRIEGFEKRLPHAVGVVAGIPLGGVGG